MTKQHRPSQQRQHGQRHGQQPSPKPSRASKSSKLPKDQRALFVLSSALMCWATFLPWVLLRPNRLAAGEYLNLPASLWGLALLAALLPLGLALWRPAWSWGGALVAGCLVGWLLGEQTTIALKDQMSFARASASSGVWLYFLGAGLAWYGTQQQVRQQVQQQTRWFRWLPLLWLVALVLMFLSGHFSQWSVLVEGRNEGARWWQELIQHLRLVGISLLVATCIGTPLSVWASRRPKVARFWLSLVSTIQTIPSLALLGLLIAPLAALTDVWPWLRDWGISGIGTAPALAAMILYALLPIFQNGTVALQNVSAEVKDSAKGMGMTNAQIFWRVEWPLTLPLWLSGLRQAAVLLVGVAAVAALIGAGGLGTYIFKGLQSAAADLILLGALPAVALALLLDSGLHWLERKVS